MKSKARKVAAVATTATGASPKTNDKPPSTKSSGAAAAAAPAKKPVSAKIAKESNGKKSGKQRMSLPKLFA
jgi:hypothetical protein